MKKFFILSILLSSLIFTSCNEKLPINSVVSSSSSINNSSSSSEAIQEEINSSSSVITPKINPLEYLKTLKVAVNKVPKSKAIVEFLIEKFKNEEEKKKQEEQRRIKQEEERQEKERLIKDIASHWHDSFEVRWRLQGMRISTLKTAAERAGEIKNLTSHLTVGYDAYVEMLKLTSSRYQKVLRRLKRIKEKEHEIPRIYDKEWKSLMALSDNEFEARLV